MTAKPSLLPLPREVGMPAKFTAWRPRQDEAIFKTAECDKRFVVICAPTGSGKSLTYMAATHIMGVRALVLTSTKGLQDQLVRDFTEIGLKDVRGMGNYPCEYLIQEERQSNLKFAGQSGQPETPMCDIAPCTAGMECDIQRNCKCHYFSATAAARASRLVVTNYAYWLHSKTDGDKGLGKFDVLVLDEAHDAPEELGSYLSVEITKSQTERMELDWPKDVDDWSYWQGWAGLASAVARGKVDILKEVIRAGIGKRKDLKEYKEFKRLADNMERVATSKGEWVHSMERRGDRGYLTLQFDPVWPGEYAERFLFKGIKKIVLTSATVRPKTLELLGVPTAESEFVEYPSTFPIERRPVIWVPTVRVDNRAGSDVMKMWVNRIDQIIAGRLDRKGIIHTVSYARRDFILRYSRYASNMVTQETRTTKDVVAAFKKMGPGKVLVSPSLSTGWDFPMDECRYQIIGKIPFPDTRNKIVKARSAKDPDYAYYITMQTLQQSAGRGMRSEDDLCETFIIDDHCSWFLSKHGTRLGSRWFMQSYRRAQTIPEAPKL